MGSWLGGDTTRIPVIPCDDWTEAQVKAFRLMVNRSVAWAEWDEDKLALELREIQEAEFDLNLTGFEDEELVRRLAAQEATDGLCDARTRPAGAPNTDLNGGRPVGARTHGLLCGDSTDPQTVSRVLGSVKPTLMVEDQPYGVDGSAPA